MILFALLTILPSPIYAAERIPDPLEGRIFTRNNFIVAGTWRGSNGIIYELTQQDSDHFTWSASFSRRRQWGSGTILGNLVRAEWKDQFSQDVFREAGVIDQRQDQMAMRISWGNGVVFSRFANPQEGEPCFLLEPQAPARRPFIDWQWLGEEPYHDIDTRPWGSSSDPDPRWYPDPFLGWDLLAYNFGQAGHFDPPRDIGNQAKVGFLLFKQRQGGMHFTPEAPTYSMRAHGGLPADAGGV